MRNPFEETIDFGTNISGIKLLGDNEDGFFSVNSSTYEATILGPVQDPPKYIKIGEEKIPIKQFLEMLKTKNECKKVQNELYTKFKIVDIENLMDQLQSYISDISMHKYGNDFIRELIDRLIFSPALSEKLLKYISFKFKEVATSEYGSKHLQKLIGIILDVKDSNYKYILSNIEKNWSGLANSPLGRPILKLFLSKTKYDDRICLNKSIIINLANELINDKYGFHILNEIIKQTKDRVIVEKVVDYIVQKGPIILANDPIAHCTILTLLQSHFSSCAPIVEDIVSNFNQLNKKEGGSKIILEFANKCDDRTIEKIYSFMVKEYDNKSHRTYLEELDSGLDGQTILMHLSKRFINLLFLKPKEHKCL